MAARNDEGLYAKARSLFISRATMDDFTGWATPRQTEAVSRLVFRQINLRVVTS